jgi:hypothetical protein
MDIYLTRWLYYRKKKIKQIETIAILIALDSGNGDLMQQARM